MKPVVDLLGTKAYIRIRYITTVEGADATSVTSLHGPAEAHEDLVQICVRNASPEKYWPYLSSFNAQCYPEWQNGTFLGSCRTNVSATLGLDIASLERCSSGQDALSVLRNDESDVSTHGASGSPTLIINGVEYTGPRTADRL